MTVMLTLTAADGATTQIMLPSPTVATSSVAAPTITNVRPAYTINSLFNVSNGGSTSSNHLSVFGTSSIHGATVNVYVDGSLNGAATTDSSGNWSHNMGVLSDAAHSVYATVASGGATSAASATYGFTVVPGLTNLPSAIGVNIGTGVYANWDGWQFATQSNNAGPTNNQTFVPIDTHTASFTILATDLWSAGGNSYNRNELEFTAMQNLGATFNITYEVMLSSSSPVNDVGAGGSLIPGWVDIGQIHDNSGGGGINTSIYQQGIGINGVGDAFYAAYKTGNAGSNAYPYMSGSNLSRGTWHTVDIICRMNPSPNGLLQVWLDGVQIVSGVNSIYGSTNSLDTYYWKFGIYRGNPGSMNQTQTVLYRNFRMKMT